MSKKIFCFIAACMPFFTSPAAAGDTEDIVALLAEVHQAYLECDADALRALAHPKWFGAFNAEGEFVRNTKHEQVRTQCAQGFRVDYQYEILKMEVHGDWAFVAGLATSELMDPNGKTTKQHLRMTWILARYEGKWKRYHVHIASVQPPAS